MLSVIFLNYFLFEWFFKYPSLYFSAWHTYYNLFFPECIFLETRLSCEISRFSFCAYSIGRGSGQELLADEKYFQNSVAPTRATPLIWPAASRRRGWLALPCFEIGDENLVLWCERPFAQLGLLLEGEVQSERCFSKFSWATHNDF